MCSIPQKFFQVCRLCLVSIEENDILTHRICDEVEFHKNLFTDCSCIINRNKMCVDLKGIESTGLIKHTKGCNKHTACSPEYVPSTLGSIPKKSNDSQKLYFGYNNVESKNRITNEKLSYNCENSDFLTENIRAKSALNIFDDSSPSIVIQILSCLSLEVSPSDQLPNLVCCNCRSNLQTLWKFKMMAQEANSVLRNFLTYCKSSNKSLSEIEIQFNNTITALWNKSASEKMAATALTELSNMSKKDSTLLEVNNDEMDKDVLLCDTASRQVEKVLKEENKSSPEMQPTHPNIISDYSSIEGTSGLEQHLETANVLMNISKNFISPQCSNSKSLNRAQKHSSSIINSVIPNKPLLSTTLPSLISTEIEQDSNFLKDLPINSKRLRLCKNENSNCLKRSKVSVITQRIQNSEHLESIVLPESESKSPDSIASEEPGTDAATTQLWQVLAHSAANQVESKESSHLLHILNRSFVYPVEASLLTEKQPTEEPISLVKY
ncbi:uncharacterized protein LOC105262412 isoform X3 [Musca domestica]|uniref:Uncharacterized protein LOC105262412 isoform X3 n=1 Tax=Musca domestica TaxID=7370 RepID=A0ABM3VIV2_MUSDO|nr:uncharacterized protein LOC105262412 isoform X3 [Musca domestica]